MNKHRSCWHVTVMSFVAYEIYAVLNRKRRCGKTQLGTINAVALKTTSIMACMKVNTFQDSWSISKSGYLFTTNVVANGKFGMLWIWTAVKLSSAKVCSWFALMLTMGWYKCSDVFVKTETFSTIIMFSCSAWWISIYPVELNLQTGWSFL